MDVVSWARRTPGGRREDQIRATFRRAGCAVDQPDDPFYIDEPMASRPVRLDIEHFPKLEAAVSSLMEGGQLVVLSVGQFAVRRVWDWAAIHLTRKRASLRDLEGERTWDFSTDPGAAFEVGRLVEQMATRLRLEAANAARAAAGKLGPRQKLADDKVMARAKRLWADSDLSAAEVAKAIGISVPTLYRHLGPKAEAEAKAISTKKPTR